MLYLLVRSPRNVPLRLVTAMMTCRGLSYAFLLAAATGHTVLGLEPLMARLIQHLFLILASYCLLLFYLFSALDVRAARRRALWQAVPLAVAALVMTIAAALVPAGIRDAAAALQSAPPTGPIGAPSV